MRSLNFNEDLKSFAINGDENRVIRFNPADPNLIKRAMQAQENIRKEQEKMEDMQVIPRTITAVEDVNEEAANEAASRESAALLQELEDVIREQVNYIFNADVYDIAFSGQSPLCIVGTEKEYLFEAFINSTLPIIEEETKGYREASQKRIEKYTKGYKK